MGEIGVGEADEGVDEGRLLPRHQARLDEIPVGRALGGQDLGVVEFPPELPVEGRILPEQPAVPAADVEGAEEVGVLPRGDRQRIGAPDPEVQAVEYLHDLGEKVPLRRVRHGEQDPHLLPLRDVLDLGFLHVEEDP